MIIKKLEMQPAFYRQNGRTIASLLNEINGGNLPAVNILENDVNFSVEVVAPGYSKEEFQIDISNNQLTVEAVKKEAEDPENNKYTHREFATKGFSRKFNIPEKLADTEAITAKYENGILTVTIPKKEEAKPKEPKVIAVS